VVWVRWVTPWYLGWYVGPGLSLRCFRLLFQFQICRSHNITVVSPLPSAQRLLGDVRRWSTVPWRGFRLFVSAWVSVRRSSPLGCALAHRDGWVCGLGAVGDSLVFGLVRGVGVFTVVFPSFVLVSNRPFAQNNRGFATSFSATSSL
jgi:hypothetical protein